MKHFYETVTSSIPDGVVSRDGTLFIKQGNSGILPNPVARIVLVRSESGIFRFPPGCEGQEVNFISRDLAVTLAAIKDVTGGESLAEALPDQFTRGVGEAGSTEANQQTTQPEKGKDLSDELWREYDWQVGEERRIYRIPNPVMLWVGKTSHRILDSRDIVHCVPTVGERGCVLRWCPRNPSKPVKW